MSTIDILRQQVTELAERRAYHDTVAAELKARRAEFDAQNGALIALEAQAKAAVQESDTAARMLGEALYHVTGDKKPLEGVVVKLMTKVTYDDDAALAWCKASGTALIPETFDRKALDKMAKAAPLPFATVVEVPSVTLASDLSAYLPAAPSDAASLTPAELQELPF